jgi:heat-inducible transcriptional repressor
LETISDSQIVELNERSREILRRVVEAYMASGDPVGSRTVSRLDGVELSPATIRNVMADLEDAGLLYAPHTSAGRLPTDIGLRLFVDGLLEIGRLGEDERARIESQCAAAGVSIDQVLRQATESLSGLSHQAGLVVAPKTEARLKHIEFVNLSPGRALVVLVAENGAVENRLIHVPLGLPASALVEATNYLAARLVGRTLGEAGEAIRKEVAEHRAQLDALASELVEKGLATRAIDGDDAPGLLIVRGQSKLLEDVNAVEDLERVRRLFQTLETKETLVRLLDVTQAAEGVQIFIGSENSLFQNSGCSMIIAPYKNSAEKVVGAIGVIGPTRMNYARIIPMVDYTAGVVGRLIG